MGNAGSSPNDPYHAREGAQEETDARMEGSVTTSVASSVLDGCGRGTEVWEYMRDGQKKIGGDFCPLNRDSDRANGLGYSIMF